MFEANVTSRTIRPIVLESWEKGRKGEEERNGEEERKKKETKKETSRRPARLAPSEPPSIRSSAQHS
jgi:hypothetical protein